MGRGDFCFGYTYRLFHGYVSVISPLQAMPDGIPPLVGTVPLRTGTPVAVHVLFMPGTFFFAYYLVLYIESLFVAYFVVTG